MGGLLDIVLAESPPLRPPAPAPATASALAPLGLWCPGVGFYFRITREREHGVTRDTCTCFQAHLHLVLRLYYQRYKYKRKNTHKEISSRKMGALTNWDTLGACAPKGKQGDPTTNNEAPMMNVMIWFLLRVASTRRLEALRSLRGTSRPCAPPCGRSCSRPSRAPARA